MIDKYIFNNFKATKESLAFFRILYAGYLLFFGIPKFMWVASSPDSFFHPPISIAFFLNGFPPETFFIFLYILTSVSVIALFFGLFTKSASFMTGISLMIGYTFAFSFGKINHSSLFFIIIPIVMASSNWGAYCSLDSLKRRKRSKVQAWPLALLALVIGFTMFTAAVPKVIGGWLDADTQAVRAIIIEKTYGEIRTGLFSNLLLNIDSNVFWEILDYVTIIFEAGFLLAIFNPSIFRFFLANAVIFHTAILLVLNIRFVSNVMVYAAFIRWDKIEWTGRFLQKIENVFKRIGMIHVTIISALYIILFIRYGSPFSIISESVQIPPLIAKITITFTIAFIVATIYFYRTIKTLFRYISKKIKGSE